MISKEHKAFLTDLIAVLEKHKAELYVDNEDCCYDIPDGLKSGVTVDNVDLIVNPHYCDFDINDMKKLIQG